jgi:myo-inositol-1(or 4)-monophosphatase
LWAQAESDDALNVWVIDPLDGTTNYSRGLYPFCTSIALYQGGAVHVGVVYDPIRNEMFAAERGRGATLNGKPIHVSTRSTLIDAVIGTEWARAIPIRRRTSAVFARLLEHVMTGRASGSAAISLCSVAAGRLDGYIHLSLAPWDVAAAALIVEEAGGNVTTPDGTPWDVHCQAYVGSNGILHRKLLRYFK